MTSENCISLARKTILDLIPLDEYAVFLFGSRASGAERAHSDMDVGFLGSKAIPAKLRFDIEMALEESKIPYHVEIVDFFAIDNRFKAFALQKAQLWNLPKNINLNWAKI